MANFLGLMAKALSAKSYTESPALRAEKLQRISGNGMGRSWGYTGATWAGQPVSPDIAMQISAVWRAIGLTSQTLATLPFGLVAADGSGRQDRGIPVDIVIRTQPNQDMDAVDFWEAMIGAMLLCGNGFARKLFAGSGPGRQVIGLALLNPWGVTPMKRSDGSRYWQYVDAAGFQSEYTLDEVFQLKGFSFDGVWGMSAVSYGAQTFSGARAAEKISNEIFKSGLSSSGFLETNQVLNEGDREELQKLMSQYAGAGNAGRMMILEGGMTYKPLSMSAADAQLLASRQFSIEEIARWFGIPPVLLFHAAQGVTNFGSGIESIVLSWYQLALRAHMRRIQAAVYRQLLSPAQKALWTPKYNFDALLQGDSTAKGALFSIYAQNGLRTRDEIRAYDDLPPIAGGDVATAQVNLAPLDKLGDTSGDAQAAKAALRRFMGIVDAPDPAPAPPPER